MGRGTVEWTDGRADCSPRGDAAGFVAVLDDRTVLLPDRRGNNRADSLSNVLENPYVGLLFLIPGVDETLRLNGRAALTTDPALLDPLAVNGRAPRSGLVVEVEEVFLQCTKALVRARLWADESRVDRKAALPSFGQMLADHIGLPDGEAIDRELRAKIRETLY